MDDDEKKSPQTISGAVRNSIAGSPSTAIQMRDLHNGNIYINSQVYVSPEPGQLASIGKVTEAAFPGNTVPHPLHVLAVDDDQDVLEDLAQALQADPRIGRVGTAADAAMALRYVQAAEHQKLPALDAWFLDVAMPGLSGMELARVGTLFAKPPAAVFVTASEAHAVEAFGLEAVDYLVKPVHPDRLKRTIDRVVRNRQAFDDQPHSGGADRSW